MRFLALTAVQGIVLAAVTTAVIVALYFLKHRRRQVIISSTQLWKRVLEHQIENSLFEKLRRYLSILLAVATGILVAMSILLLTVVELLRRRSERLRGLTA